jgi:hypothetical protein
MSVDRPLSIYFLLAFAITWGVDGLALARRRHSAGRVSPLNPLHYIAASGRPSPGSS